MASLGHIVVGMAAARVYRPDAAARRPALAAMLFWAALSFLPDADVIGFGVGVRYEDPWGHRGATHSLAFSLALGTLIGLLAPRFGRPAVRTGVIATLVVASHALLDTLTDGGLGCALFWPFDLTRYFAPWTPLPVSPIGLGYLSPYGLYVAMTEMALFAPVLFYALRGQGQQTAKPQPFAVGLGVAAWLLGLWLLMGNDPVRDRLIRAALRELGSAARPCWLYNRSPDNGYFRARAVCFTNGPVTSIVRRWLKE